jgi:hypothetical protein
MATSSAEDVPRTLDFLFSRNRLNVAVSRANDRADAFDQRAVSVRGDGGGAGRVGPANSNA